MARLGGRVASAMPPSTTRRGRDTLPTLHQRALGPLQCVHRAGAGWVQVGADWCRLVATHGCMRWVGIGPEDLGACEGVYYLQTEPLLALCAAACADLLLPSHLRAPEQGRS